MHRWCKLQVHRYVCRKCGTCKQNKQADGQWQTTYYLPDGTEVVSSRVPACEAGRLTTKRLSHYADRIATDAQAAAQ
jgi:hypothetical protein